MCWSRGWNEAALEQALAQGALNEQDKEGATPLWHAVFFGNADWTQRLLEAGANPDGHDPRRIDRAGGSSHVVSIWRGLPEHADRSAAGRGTLLHVAAARVGSPEVAGLLLARGAEVDGRDRYGCTALHIAAFGGHLPLVELLLQQGADVNAIDCAGLAAVDHAGNRIDVVRALLAAGAASDGGPRINWGGKAHEWSVITNAAYSGWTDILDELFAAGADVAKHPLALPLAALQGRANAVRRLLKARADVDATYDWQNKPRPALEAAACTASVSCVRALIPACRHQLDRALRAAVERSRDDVPEPPNNRQETVGLLLKEGADPSMGLLEATGLEDPRYAQLLIEAGAEANVRDEEGSTALHLTARRGTFRVTRLLLSVGADVHAEDGQGRTPFAVAEQAYHRDRLDDARLVMNAIRDAGGGPPKVEAPAPPPEPSTEPEVGCRVTHPKFGGGIVAAISGVGDSTKLTVDFDHAGRKILLRRFVERVEP